MSEKAKITKQPAANQGGSLRFLSGLLNRREALLFFTGRDPASMDKIAGAFVHYFRSYEQKDELRKQ